MRERRPTPAAETGNREAMRPAGRGAGPFLTPGPRESRRRRTIAALILPFLFLVSVAAAPRERAELGVSARVVRHTGVRLEREPAVRTHIEAGIRPVSAERVRIVTTGNGAVLRIEREAEGSTDGTSRLRVVTIFAP